MQRKNIPNARGFATLALTIAAVAQLSAALAQSADQGAPATAASGLPQQTAAQSAPLVPSPADAYAAPARPNPNWRTFARKCKRSNRN